MEDALKAANKAVYKHFKGLIRPLLVDVAVDAAAPYIRAEALRAAAKEARIRGDVGKEEEGGIAAWDFLEWRADMELGD